MSGAFQNIVAPSLPVVAKNPPPEGQMITPFNFVLTATQFSINQSFALGPNSMSQVRTLYVDNSENAQALTVTHGVGSQTTLVPAGGGAILPTASTQGNYYLKISTPIAPPADTAIGIGLYNYEIPPALWGTQIVTITQTVPIGTVMLWYGSRASIPNGFGACDGTVYNRTDGQGSITSPNLSNVYTQGASGQGGGDNFGTTGGSRTIARANLPIYNLPITDGGHWHGVNDPTHAHTVNGIFYTSGGVAGGNSGWWATNNTTSYAATGISIKTATTGISVSSGGGGANYDPPFMRLWYIMKY